MDLCVTILKKAPSLCLSNPRPSGLSSRCPQHPMLKPGYICFSSHRPSVQGYIKKAPVSIVQDNPNHPRLVDQTVVLGPSGDVSRHTQTTTTNLHSAQTATEQPLQRQPNFLESRGSTLQEHRFNAEVTERIAAPQVSK